MADNVGYQRAPLLDGQSTNSGRTRYDEEAPVMAPAPAYDYPMPDAPNNQKQSALLTLDDVDMEEYHDVVKRVASPAMFCGLFIVMHLAVGGSILWLTLLPWDVSNGYNTAVIVIMAVTCFALLVCYCMLGGVFVVQPNSAKVLSLCGRYVGTVKAPGMHFTNPLYAKQTVSLKVRNFETDKLKVNDARGNPIEVAGVVVWHVVDAAAALFQIRDYAAFTRVQSESAFRNLVARYPYDSYNGETSLLGNTAEIAAELKTEIQARVGLCGIHIVEATINRISYSSEIAGAMLQRQQASALVAARREIVNGAVSMCNDAMDQIRTLDLCEFSDAKKADTVANLLVVLCSDSRVQPTLPLN